MSDQLESALHSLQALEGEIQEADSKVEQYKQELFSSIYEKRSSLITQVPKFWYVVLAQHEDFQEFIRVEDMPYLENIKNIYVKEFLEDTEKVTIENEEFEIKKKGFTITIEFDSSKDLPAQTITKKFEWELQTNGSKKLISEPVKVQWPKSLNSINPDFIKSQAKKANRKISPEEKKSYRLGMRSFWAWFAWTGEKLGKEFRNGEDLALCISEDIFPAALDYYVLAMPGLGEENGDEEEVESGEELDLSDDEEIDEEDQDGDHVSKKQKTD